MDKIKLETKDIRILNCLDKNSRQTLGSIAKKVRVSRQVADYRINKLIKQKTIYAFYTLIDVGRLGYSTFRVHLRVKNLEEKSYTEFAESLFNNYPTFWVAFVAGSFDIMVDIFAKNITEFEKIMDDILVKKKEIIQSYEVFTVLELILYDYGYFSDKKEIRNKCLMHKNAGEDNIDDTDKKILDNIKKNSRLSYLEIANKIGVTRFTVKRRIKQLEERKIIAGYRPLINFNHFDKQSFKIFIKYDYSKIDQEKKLLDEIQQTPGILNILKFMGKWNLDIEIHKKDSRELQQYIIRLRNRHEIIEDYEIVQIIDDYDIDFFPEKLDV